MPYPNEIDEFNEKLNKKDTLYVIEEEVIPTNGVYENMLAHDNIVDSSLRVYTGSKLTGDRVDNIIVSIPSDMDWKRLIKIFSNASKLFITYETHGDQIEAEDINKLQESMTATQTEVDRYKEANDSVVNNTVNRVTVLENNKAEKTYVDTELLKKADKVNTYTKTETDQRIQAIVGAAPDALDTLQEIGESLNNDPNFAATMTNELTKKVDKVPGKQLSAEDYTTVEKSKLAGIETGAQKNVVTKVAGKTGDVTVTKTDVGLPNVDNVKQASKAEFDAFMARRDNPFNVTSEQVNVIDPKSVNDLPNTYPMGVTVSFIAPTDPQSAGWLASLGLSGNYYLIINTKKTTTSNGTQHVTAYQLSASGNRHETLRSALNTSWGTWDELAFKSDLTSEQVTMQSSRLPTDLASAYPRGYTYAPMTVNDPNVDVWIDEINSVLGTNYTSAQIRMKVSTERWNSGGGAEQTIVGVSNFTVTLGKILFILKRGASSSSPSSPWSPWVKIIDENDLVDYVTRDELGTAGYGDMLKSVYDKNDDGVIDRAKIADSVEWSNVSNKPDIVNKEEFDALEIGGRNLIENSGVERTSSGIYNYPLDFSKLTESVGKEVIVSFDAKSDSTGFVLDCYFRNVSTALIVGIKSPDFNISTEYERYSFVLIVSDDIFSVSNGSFAIRRRSGTGNYSIKNIKLEKGNIATDWTPAPEDLMPRGPITWNDLKGV